MARSLEMSDDLRDRGRDLSAKEAARIIGVDVQAVYRALSSGHLPGYRLHPAGAWRIPRAQLDQFRFGGGE